jgi:hypothetical protein
MIESKDSGVVWQAITEARAKFPVLRKDTDAHYGKFVNFNTIREQVDPILAEFGLVIFQWPDTTDDGKPALTTKVRHESGEFVQATTPLVLSKQDPQAQGSAITYMKRYSYNTILSLKNMDDDDDGDVASLPDKQVQTAKGDNRAARNQRTELEAAFKQAGMSIAKGTKWYHDNFGKDYKSETDDQNLAKAIVKLAGLTG